MIMYSLAPTQSGFAPVLTDVNEAMDVIHDLLVKDVEVHTRTFNGPDNRPVSVFWTTTPEGAVATVWEYTYGFFTFNAPLTPDQSHATALILAEQDEVHSAEHTAGRDDRYAVGE